jgi:xanthine dehydrogenase accessory factor
VSAAIELLLECFAKSQPCALATITRIDGRAPRRVGAQMAISAHTSAGSLSGGCLDATIIEHTRAQLAERQSFQLRFGEGSPFMDLALPCGSQIELQIDCGLDPQTLTQIQTAYRARKMFYLYWPELAQPAQFGANAHEAQAIYQFPYYPRLRLVLAGKGEALLKFAKIAAAVELEVLALTPDQETLAALKADQIACLWLNGAETNWQLDPFSAAITLFHDHDLELPFLRQALHSTPLLIAAMGAPRARELRNRALLEQGCSAEQIARIESPFGLIERARDPETLAVSMLAACMQRYRDRYFPEVSPSRRHGRQVLGS